MVKYADEDARHDGAEQVGKPVEQVEGASVREELGHLREERERREQSDKGKKPWKVPSIPAELKGKSRAEYKKHAEMDEFVDIRYSDLELIECPSGKKDSQHDHECRSEGEPVSVREGIPRFTQRFFPHERGVHPADRGILWIPSLGRNAWAQSPLIGSEKYLLMDILRCGTCQI